MPLFPTLDRKTEREAISTEVKSHNRPYAPKKLDPKPARQARPREEVWAETFENAKAELASMTPANAVRHMETLPITLLECYLLAEEATQARELILRRFPKPGSQARQRYLPKPAKRAPKRGGKALTSAEALEGPDAQGQEN